MNTVTHRTRVRQSREETRARIVAAATGLLRRRAFAELTVDEVMQEAGQGRTIFYRHFDDLADLVSQASREAIEALYRAQQLLGKAPGDHGPDVIRDALELAVDVYHRHGPLLRGVAEAAAGDEQMATAHAGIRRRFDELAEQWLREVRGRAATPPERVAQTARALNLMNESYLLDTFGREPRASTDAAVDTLSEIWMAVIRP